MKALLLLVACLVGIAYAKTRWHELEPTGYDHNMYMEEYRKVYASEEERAMRKSIFDRNLAAIKEHNRKPHMTWKNGVNHLTDRTPEEYRKLLGLRREWAHASVAKNDVPLHKITGKVIPPSVDYREVPGVLTSIKDQGQCGSCWTFAASSAIESQWFLATGDSTVLSSQQIASCTSNPNDCGGTGGCEGGTFEVAFQSIINNGGIASEWTYPYLSYSGTDYPCKYPNNQTTTPIVTLTGFVRVQSNSYTAFLDAVAHVGPLAITVDASAWQFYENGIFNGCNQASPDLDHGVQVVGYGTDAGTPYWIVRNSWSPLWGENGYIRLYRSAQPQCGIDTKPSDGTGCNGGPANVTVCGTCGILYDNCYPIVSASKTLRAIRRVNP